MTPVWSRCRAQSPSGDSYRMGNGGRRRLLAHPKLVRPDPFNPRSSTLDLRPCCLDACVCAH
eukprot:1750529-Rhodomonas_salina.4